MRIISLVTSTLLACGAALAGNNVARPQSTTYVGGTVGVSPNTNGTLVLSDEKSLVFRSGHMSVAVPYSGISKAELGEPKPAADAPLYKVWTIQKRFMGKAQTQLLTVDFKNDKGDAKTIKLELAETSAPAVLSSIEKHSKITVIAPKPKVEAAAATPAKPTNNEWWGDDFWKTTRNADKWNKPASVVSAP